MKKLRTKNGESLIETLVSVIIISLGMMLLVGSIIAAARINDRSMSDYMVTLEDETDAATNSCQASTVTVTYGSMTTDINVNLYTQTSKEGTGRELYYYRVAS